MKVLATVSEHLKNLVKECVDRGLEVLGESSRSALYYHLEKSYGVKPMEIADYPQRFIDALRSIFGEGSRILEESMTKEARELLDVPSDVNSFAGVIEAAAKRERAE